MTAKAALSSIFALLPIFAFFSVARAAMPMTLSSSAFAPGASIPASYTCSGVDQSPPLEWQSVPSSAQSLALIVSDPDAPSRTFIHWVVFNLPPDGHGLKSAPHNSTAAGGDQGVNGKVEIGYNGPCPPPGPVHHYHFKLYALDKKLSLSGHPDAHELERAMAGHVIDSAETVGTFKR